MHVRFTSDSDRSAIIRRSHAHIQRVRDGTEGFDRNVVTGTLSSLDSARKPNSPGPSALKLSSLMPIVASCGLLRWRAGHCPPIKESQSGRPSIRLQLSWVNIHSSSCVEKRHDQRSGAPMKRVLCALIFCLVCVLAVDVNAQSWPNRPLKLIVPTGPGAATDVMARMLADGVSRKLDQSMVVENMPGASGIVAHQTVARAAPDGYTFLFTNTSGMAINLISFKQLPYDPTKDFTAVATVCNQGPQMISVNAELPVKTLSDLIAYAKANRGKLSIAFDTTAGAAAFAAKLFNRRADLGLVEVPYRSAAQMTQ